jgi:Tfp pilus assembly protein PilO
MKDVLVKILSHLSKNTLAMIVVILGGMVVKYWYTDYTQRQDAIMSTLKEQDRMQRDFRIESRDNFNATSVEIKGIKDQIIQMDGRQDIIIRSMPQIKRQIKEYDEVFQKVKESQGESMAPIQPRNAELYADIKPDSVKKKLTLGM